MIKGIDITNIFAQNIQEYNECAPPPSYRIATTGYNEPPTTSSVSPRTVQLASQPLSNGFELNESRGIMSWLERYKKNKPQINSVVAGFLLMLVSGLHIGWGVYRLYLRGHWNRSWRITNVQLILIVTVFYIASNIGAGIGHYLLVTMKKRNIYYICALLNIISSLAFMIGYDEIGTIFVGRIFAGLAYGICYITVIVHASENSIKELRGLIVSPINYCIIVSIFIITIFNNLPMGYDKSTSIDFWIGLISLICSILAIISVPFLTYESIIFLLNKDDDNTAIINMMKLRNEYEETLSIRKNYEEIKLMINEDKNDTTNLFRNNHGIYLLMLTQFMSTISTSFALNIIMLLILKLFENETLLVVPRLITSLIPMFFSDSIGRRNLLFIANFLGGSCIIVLGILIAVDVKLKILTIVVFLFQAFIGLGTNSIAELLLSEAFSSTKKNGSVCSLFIFEQITHIILIAITININYYININRAFLINVPILFGVLMILMTIFSYYYLPETKKKSLRETRNLFKFCRRVN